LPSIEVSILVRRTETEGQDVNVIPDAHMVLYDVTDQPRASTNARAVERRDNERLELSSANRTTG